MNNCSRAHPRLEEELCRRTIPRMFAQVLPLIVKRLGVKDALQIPNVCHEWRDAVAIFDKHVPGRQPYDDQLFLNHMKTLGKDPGEHKWNTDIWFLSFFNRCDLQSFESVLMNPPVKTPFSIGTSAYFEIGHRDCRVKQTYLFLLRDFMKKYGRNFSYIKLNFTESYSLQNAQDFANIRLVLENTPNVLSVEIEGDFTSQTPHHTLLYTEEHVLIPHLPLLESLSLLLGRNNTKQHERNAIKKHAKHLKKLSITARAGFLPRQMPCLVELYFHRIHSEKIFWALEKLEAPLLQKLTLELINIFCFRLSDRADLVERIAHLPLRQLILKWGRLTGDSNLYGNFNCFDPDKMRTIQVSSLHTLTIYNYPDDWTPFLNYFPSLAYLNIRITNCGTMSSDAQEKLRNREELVIKGILYGVKEEGTKHSSDSTNFPQLKQISFEMWGTYGSQGPGKLVHSKIWTRNPRESESAT